MGKIEIGTGNCKRGMEIKFIDLIQKNTLVYCFYGKNLIKLLSFRE